MDVEWREPMIASPSGVRAGVCPPDPSALPEVPIDCPPARE
jgi:hypothetical protein